MTSSPIVERQFVFSEPLFRVRLDRIIDPVNPRVAAVGMQNSSTAESDAGGKNDPTILRLNTFLRHLGYGRYIAFNPHPFRASQPSALYKWYDDLGLEERHAYREWSLTIAREICREADTVVAASGNCYLEDDWIKTFWRALGTDFPLYAFGFTNGGAPKHPMARGKARLPDAATLTQWVPA
jgi:hypothetical protein